MARTNTGIEQYLFKPLILSDEGESRPIIIIGCDTSTRHTVSYSGKLEKDTIDIVHILNISKTIMDGEANIESFAVTSLPKFKKSVREPKDDELNVEVMLHAAQLILNEIQNMSRQMQTLGQAVTAIKYIASGSKDTSDVSNVIIGNEDTAMVKVVLKTVTGDDIKLEREDIEKIGGVIMEIIHGNLNIDPNDPDQLRKLRGEIDYKIVEALPPTLSAKDIRLNMEAIIDEIKRYRDMSSDNDNDNTNEPNGDI